MSCLDGGLHSAACYLVVHRYTYWHFNALSHGLLCTVWWHSVLGCLRPPGSRVKNIFNNLYMLCCCSWLCCFGPLASTRKQGRRDVFVVEWNLASQTIKTASRCLHFSLGMAFCTGGGNKAAGASTADICLLSKLMWHCDVLFYVHEKWHTSVAFKIQVFLMHVFFLKCLVYFLPTLHVKFCSGSSFSLRPPFSHSPIHETREVPAWMQILGHKCGILQYTDPHRFSLGTRWEQSHVTSSW